MDLNQLRTFQLVAFLKSFSQAAAELHLTQPAVTKQIKNLEEELETLLIERFGRSLSLTSAGEELLLYAEQITNLTEQASEAIRQFSGERGRLVIGAGTTNTIFRLPNILQEYHREHPQIEIRIRNGNSDFITKLVMENAVDLGLVTTIDPNVNLKNLPLFTDKICLVAPLGFPKTIEAGELAKESLLLFRAGSGFRRFLDDQFQNHQFSPKVRMELESIEAILRFVRNGLGLAFLPKVAIREEVDNKTMTQLEVKGWNPMYRHTYLIHRHDKYLSWPVRTFLQYLLDNIPNRNLV